MPADDLVHALKYEGWPELAEGMARDMALLELPIPAAPGKRAVVPVPTSARRLRSRGYNQAELLAKGVAERLGLPFARPLQRVEEARSQTTLSPAERRENVRGAFSTTDSSDRPLRSTHVLLVDDVLTTGATASEAARVLARMGAESITLVAFARALPSTVR